MTWAITKFSFVLRSENLLKIMTFKKLFFFRMSHTLKRNLTGLGSERKKPLKLKTVISSLFHGKKS